MSKPTITPTAEVTELLINDWLKTNLKNSFRTLDGIDFKTTDKIGRGGYVLTTHPLSKGDVVIEVITEYAVTTLGAPARASLFPTLKTHVVESVEDDGALSRVYLKPYVK